MPDYTPTPSTDPAELEQQAQRNWEQFKQQSPSPTPAPTPHPWLAQLRAKFPGQYDHLDDATLAQKLAKNDPQYQWLLKDVGATQGAVVPPPPELEEEVQREYRPQGDVDPVYTGLDVVRGAFEGALTGGPTGAVIGATKEGIRSALTQKVGAVGARTGAQVGERIGGTPGRTAGAVIGGIATPLLAGGTASSGGKWLRGESEMADVGRAAKGIGEKTVAQAGEALAGHQQNLESAVAKAEQEAGPQLAQLHEKITKGATKEAQQDVLKGVTPPKAASAFEPGSGLPTEATAAQEAETYKNLTAGIQRTKAEWRTKRDALLGEFAEQPIEAPQVAQAVQTQQVWLTDNNRAVSGAVSKLMNEATELTMLAPGTPAQQIQFVTVQKLLGLQSKANLLGRTAQAPTDRAVAHSISDAIDQALQTAGGPNLQPLYAQYWALMGRAPGNYSLLVSNPSNVGKTAAAVFDNPERAAAAINAATPEELKTFRQLYGQAAQADPKFIKPQHAGVVNTLFKNTPLQTPEGFAQLKARALSFEQLMEMSPQVGEKVAQSMLDAALAQRREIAKQIAREAVTEARKMGALGKPILERIEAAGASPERQAEVATQAIMGMSTEEAGKLALAETAKEGKLVGPAPTTPDEMAVRTLQSNPTLGSGTFEWLRRRSPLYIAYTAMQASGLAAGAAKPSPYIAAMAALGGLLNVRKYFRSAFVRAMEDPQRASAFWKAVQEPQAPGALKSIGREMQNAFMQTAPFGYGSAMAGAEQAGRKAQEPEELPEQTTTTPMQQTYYRTSAQQSLGGPDAHTEDVDRLAKTHKQLQTGKTPDVQGDLRSGRLSVPALKETLTKVTQSNAPGLLQYMGPDDAMAMLQVASPQEKQWLEPLVRQKLQQAVQNPKTAPWMKQQAQAMLASLGQ